MAEGRKYAAKRESWGRIRKLPSRRFQASYPAPDGEVYNAPMTFSSKEDARTWLSGIRTDIERSKWKSPKAARAEIFREYATVWVEQRINSKGQPLRPKTRAEYTRQLDVGLSTFAADKLEAITPARVRAWHAGRMKKGKTAAGAEARLLRAIMTDAVKDDIVARNPVDSKLTKSSAGKKFRPPTLAELATLHDNVDDRFKLGVLLGAYGGLRMSEWRSLRRKDLLLSEGRYFIQVTRQAQWVNGIGWVVGPPKSDRGIRNVALPTWMTARIDAHLGQRVSAFPDGLLFAPKGKSEFIHDSDFNKSWVSAQDAAGVRGQVREHDLRGFASSHLVHTAGGNIFEARDFLGHANARTTEQHYINAVNDRSTELADRMPTLPAPSPSNLSSIKPKTGTDAALDDLSSDKGVPRS